MIVNATLYKSKIYIWLLANEYIHQKNGKRFITPPTNLLCDIANFYFDSKRSQKISFQKIHLSLPTQGNSIRTEKDAQTTFEMYEVSAYCIPAEDFLQKTERQFRLKFPKKKFPNIFLGSSLLVVNFLAEYVHLTFVNNQFSPEINIQKNEMIARWVPLLQREMRFHFEYFIEHICPESFWGDPHQKPMEQLVDFFSTHLKEVICEEADGVQNMIRGSILNTGEKNVIRAFYGKTSPQKIPYNKELSVFNNVLKDFNDLSQVINSNFRNPYQLLVRVIINEKNDFQYEFKAINQSTSAILDLNADEIPLTLKYKFKRTLNFLFEEVEDVFNAKLIIERDAFVDLAKEMEAHSQTHSFKFECPDGLRASELVRPRAIAHVESKDFGGSFFSTDVISKVEWKVMLGDQEIDLKELERLAKANESIYIKDQTMISVDLENIQSFLKELKSIQKRALTPLDILRHDSLMGSCEFQLDTGWIKRVMSQLQGQTAIKDLEMPTNIEATLRPYQLRGFSWLNFMSQLQLGACLADDMGLGKTIQTICFLQHLKNSGKLSEKVLVICPTSLMANWAHEITTFAPELRHIIYHGKERDLSTCDVDVVITSYGITERDSEDLKKHAWSVAILDEAQHIKNPSAKQTRAVKSLPARYRIALTGTPVENSADDMWSIMDFLNPSLLGTHTWFKSYFSKYLKRGEDTNDEAKERTQQLKKMIQPFLLRRLKSDRTIIADLPEKLEHKTFCNLTIEQTALYKATVDHLMKSLEGLSGFERRGLILSTLMRLKQICNHPKQVLKEDKKPLANRSGKLDLLLELVDEILDRSEKTLIFTQFREMGEFLVQAIETRAKQKAIFLHGGTPATTRAKMVENFQNDPETKIFVLSLKAGGTGLNLTAASHVIHFDRWWNPAVENQATDRAHRIGQEKIVEVHKLISTGSIEERIDQLIDHKKNLCENVIGAGEGWITELSNNELQDLFSLKAS